MVLNSLDTLFFPKEINSPTGAHTTNAQNTKHHQATSHVRSTTQLPCSRLDSAIHGLQLQRSLHPPRSLRLPQSLRPPQFLRRQQFLHPPRYLCPPQSLRLPRSLCPRRPLPSLVRTPPTPQRARFWLTRWSSPLCVLHAGFGNTTTTSTTNGPMLSYSSLVVVALGPRLASFRLVSFRLVLCRLTSPRLASPRLVSSRLAQVVGLQAVLYVGPCIL
jgi:hypothetical protein